MVTANDQQQIFQDRLARIRNKQETPAPPKERVESARARTHAPKVRYPEQAANPIPSVWTNLAYPMGLIGAFLVGAIAVFAARYARFHIVGGSMVGEDADVAMMMDAALAMAVGFVFRSFFSFEAKEYLTAKTLGIAAMIALMHNLVHWSPGLFAGLFSVDYVLLTQEMTEPNSILFRGVSFVLVEPEPAVAAPAMPTYVDIGR